MRSQSNLKILPATIRKVVRNSLVMPAFLLIPLSVSADEPNDKAAAAADTSMRLEVVEVIGRKEQTTFATET